jgi:hypothetical protein
LFDHRKDPPGKSGVAVKSVVSPLQIVSLFTETVGVGLTVTVTVSEAEHPFHVYVAEYVVVCIGFTVIELVV